MAELSVTDQIVQALMALATLASMTTAVVALLRTGSRSDKEDARQAGEELGRTAHSLKGITAAFGLEDLRACFASIEEAAEARDLARAKDYLSVLGPAALAASATLRQWLEKA